MAALHIHIHRMRDSKESSNAMPLPDTMSGKAVYDLPGDDGSIRVLRRADGSYYGAADRFDTTAPNAEAMRTKLRGWRAKYVGWE